MPLRGWSFDNTYSKAASHSTSDETFLGRYRRVATLGQGAFGEVELVGDLVTGLPIAVKFTAVEAGLEALGEAQTLANLPPHVNVIDYLYVRTVEDRVALFMEPAWNGSMREAMRMLSLDDDRLVSYALQSARGLQHVHRHGLLHLDLKPENILVMDGRDRVAVCDFGLARLRGSLNDKPPGTARYRSPEQAASAEIDAETDYYSWALCFIEGAVGRRPWRSGEDAAAALHGMELPTNAPALLRGLLRIIESPPGERGSEFLATVTELDRQVADRGITLPEPRVATYSKNCHYPQGFGRTDLAGTVNDITVLVVRALRVTRGMPEAQAALMAITRSKENEHRTPESLLCETAIQGAMVTNILKRCSETAMVLAVKAESLSLTGLAHKFLFDVERARDLQMDAVECIPTSITNDGLAIMRIGLLLRLAECSSTPWSQIQATSSALTAALDLGLPQIIVHVAVTYANYLADHGLRDQAIEIYQFAIHACKSPTLDRVRARFECALNWRIMGKNIEAIRGLEAADKELLVSNLPSVFDLEGILNFFEFDDRDTKRLTASIEEHNVALFRVKIRRELGCNLTDIGDHDAAIAQYDAAEVAMREIYSSFGDNIEEDVSEQEFLSTLWLSKSISLRALGRHQEAESVLLEVVRLRRNLAADTGGVEQAKSLLNALSNLCQLYLSAGNIESWILTFEEGTKILAGLGGLTHLGTQIDPWMRSIDDLRRFPSELHGNLLLDKLIVGIVDRQAELLGGWDNGLVQGTLKLIKARALHNLIGENFRTGGQAALTEDVKICGLIEELVGWPDPTSENDAADLILPTMAYIKLAAIVASESPTMALNLLAEALAHLSAVQSGSNSHPWTSTPEYVVGRALILMVKESIESPSAQTHKSGKSTRNIARELIALPEEDLHPVLAFHASRTLLHQSMVLDAPGAVKAVRFALRSCTPGFVAQDSVNVLTTAFRRLSSVLEQGQTDLGYPTKRAVDELADFAYQTAAKLHQGSSIDRSAAPHVEELTSRCRANLL